MVAPVEFSNPKTWPIAADNKGVANENVVAVPAINAKIAIKSMTFPIHPSTLSFKIGRHASENFCFSTLRTCNMKPNATANII